jgi:steroid delta-isomerase-like uncharacterized protein
VGLEENKEILRKVDYELFVTGNVAAGEEYIHPDCVDHNSQPGQASGRQGIVDFAKVLTSAFSDTELQFVNLIAEGDKAVAHWSMQSTHTGEFFGIPATNKRINITGTDVVRIVDGKITDWWHNEDVLGMMGQLGVGPA